MVLGKVCRLHVSAEVSRIDFGRLAFAALTSLTFKHSRIISVRAFVTPMTRPKDRAATFLVACLRRSTLGRRCDS